MAIRNVVQVGDDVLRQKCMPVEKFDEKLVQISQMTSYQAVYQLEQYQQDFPQYKD